MWKMSRKKSKKPRKFGRQKVRPNIIIREEPWDRKPRRMDDASINFME